MKNRLASYLIACPSLRPQSTQRCTRLHGALLERRYLLPCIWYLPYSSLELINQHIPQVTEGLRLREAITESPGPSGADSGVEFRNTWFHSLVSSSTWMDCPYRGESVSDTSGLSGAWGWGLPPGYLKSNLEMSKLEWLPWGQDCTQTQSLHSTRCPPTFQVRGSWHFWALL